MNKKIPADAFDHYVALGAARSYEAVAQRYNATKRAVTACARREDWSGRLEKIERQARERADDRLTETLAGMHERHMKTLRAMNARALTALKEHPLSTGMEAMRAAEMVIKLERSVTGQNELQPEMQFNRQVVIVHPSVTSERPAWPPCVLEVEELEAKAQERLEERRRDALGNGSWPAAE